MQYLKLMNSNQKVLSSRRLYLGIISRLSSGGKLSKS